jgi:hypothetical protein
LAAGKFVQNMAEKEQLEVLVAAPNKGGILCKK